MRLIDSPWTALSLEAIVGDRASVQILRSITTTIRHLSLVLDLPALCAVGDEV